MGKGAVGSLLKDTSDHDKRPYGTSPNPQKATATLFGSAIGALIAQEDEGGVEQPIYYISCALRDAETCYPRAERTCLAIVYTSQRLRY